MRLHRDCDVFFLNFRAEKNFLKLNLYPYFSQIFKNVKLFLLNQKYNKIEFSSVKTDCQL